MANPFSTSKFKQLKSKWYRKLKAHAFDDIEDTTSPNEMLKTWTCSYFQVRYHPLVFTSNAAYYRQATHAILWNIFDQSLEKAIWQRHAEGHSVRGISKELGIKVNFVHKTIVKYRLRIFGFK